MTHEAIHQRLGEWLDGELDPAASEAASRHVDGCAACRSEVSRLRRLGEALFSPPAPADPRAIEAFVARVMSRVEAESVPPWERLAGRWLAPAFGLALAVLVAATLRPDADPDLPLDAQLLADGHGALPSFDAYLEPAP